MHNPPLMQNPRGLAVLLAYVVVLLIIAIVITYN